MPASWTGELKGELHNAQITVNDIAREAGMNPKYVSFVLHSNNPSEKAKNKLFDALARLKSRKEPTHGPGT